MTTRFFQGSKKLKAFALAAMVTATSFTAKAGGINTNTNMSAAFARMPSRDAIIAIDGAYFNPAGVAFLSPGFHMNFNWQLITQKRYIDNQYPLFTNNADNPTDSREFKGTALVPFFPSFQLAYNWHDFSFQAAAGVTAGGGKCTFDDGLGSFERIVSEIAYAAGGPTGLASVIDNSLYNAILGAGLPEQVAQGVRANGFASANNFGNTGSYNAYSFMRGRQFYYSMSLGAAYKVTPDLSVFAGARGVYASCNYYGYVRGITVGNMPLYQVLDPTKESSADIELNCDQTGFGVTPIISIDYKLGRWNFAAKYEFKTRMRLKNSSVNSFPSIGNLGSNLSNAIVSSLDGTLTPILTSQIQAKHPTLSADEAHILANAQLQNIATTALADENVQHVTSALQQGFNSGIGAATGAYEDGKKVAADIPAIVTVGVAYTPIDQLRLNAGFHYYFDKQATQYGNTNKKLDRGTIEYSFGAEGDVTKWLTVSAGYQRTSYGLSDEYMDDKSFVTSSNNIGVGAMIHVTHRARVNVGYFHTFYEKKNTTTASVSTGLDYVANYTRKNDVFGASLELDL